MIKQKNKRNKKFNKKSLLKSNISTSKVDPKSTCHHSYYDNFYNKNGLDVHDDSHRFSFISSLCIDNVLDIGCGTGTLSDYFFGPYRGVDFSKEAINLAIKHRRETASFGVSSLSQLDTLNIPQYKTIVIAEVLEHLEDYSSVVSKLKSLCEKGQRLIISVPNGNAVPDPSHIHTFTIPQLKKIFGSLGKVKFYNWSGATARIIMSVDIGVEYNPILSLAMIVKNEALGLENAILSCIDFVDHIKIAVDDLSNDKTKEIALKYADEVVDLKWQNSFAKARAFVDKGIKTKWILSLDGHEIVSKIGNLDTMLKLENDGLSVEIKMENGSIITYPRIYRAGLEWTSDVHNLIGCKNPTAFYGFQILHDRIGGQSQEAISERNKQRDKMMIDIMGKRIKENKKDARASFQLALFYHGKGRKKEAIKLYRSTIKNSSDVGTRWMSAFNISLIYYSEKRFFRALMSAHDVEKLIPHRWENKKLFGIIWFAKDNYSKAVSYLVDSLNKTKGEFNYKPIPFDVSSTWSLIGECFFHLKEYDKSHTAFERSLTTILPDCGAYLSANMKDTQKELLKKRIKFIERNFLNATSPHC